MNTYDIAKNTQERAKRLNLNECLVCGWRMIHPKLELNKQACFNKDCKEFNKTKEMVQNDN